MKNNIDKPFINIEIYRLDIYRLLTLLLSDKQIAKNNTFSKLGTDFTDGEVNRLLVLIAVISRQLLNFLKTKNKKTHNELSKQECGKYLRIDKQINFRMACNFIVHANDILLYQLPDKEIKREADDVKYFKDIITIITQNKRNKMTTTELDLPLFAKTCIMLSEHVKGSVMPTNRTTYKYNLKEGNKIIHTGITNNLERREQEHQRERGDGVHIKQVGIRTTIEAALSWEAEQRKQGKPTGP